MKSSSILLLITIFSFIEASYAQQNKWQLWATGLPQGTFPKLAIAKNHDIYYGLVGTSSPKGIIYKSNTLLSNGQFEAMPIIPIPKSITNNIQDIICNDNNEPIVGIFRSDISEPFIFKYNFSNNSWLPVNVDYPPVLGAFCMAKSPNGNIWVGAKWSYIYISTDQGNSFKRIDETALVKNNYPCYYPSWGGVPSDGAIYSINVDHKGRLYAGTEGAGIIYSDDDGTSFHPADYYACQSSNATLKDSLSPMKALSYTGNLGALGFTKNDDLIFNGTNLWAFNWKQSLGFADMDQHKVYEVNGFLPYLITAGLQVTKIVTTDNGHIYLHSGSNTTTPKDSVGIYTSLDGINWHIFNDGISSVINGQSQGALAVDGNTVFFATHDGKIWKYESSTTTSIHHQTIENNIKIFPNPASTKLYFDNQFEHKMISIYNSNGSLVQTSTITNQQIDMSTLPNGLYYYKIDFNTNLLTGKFLKQNF
ncbi:MAG: T9SS type A sorting domain-containing protein [Saprospiraceae bacterium]|jgi:hypothetical protein|nr:T9SS type A sorting domain-containing protein [Saprospiraceae bacterium]